MRLLEFVERYNNTANNTLREQLLSKIKITPYVSFIKKDAYAQLIVDKTTFEQEAYDDNGVTKYRKTDKIRVNSVAQYVQFCRAVIELYTDLEIDEDDKGFINGYDALKSSGLLDILMVGSDKVYSQKVSRDTEKLNVTVEGKGNITVKVYIANEDESSNGILAKNATIDLNSENTVLNVD